MTFGATPTPPPHPPRRSAARRFLPLAVIAWLVLEVWLLRLVAEAAGGWTVLLLLIAGVVAGSYVIKRAGRRAWRRLAESVQSGTAPEPAKDGGNTLPMLGGLLLILPGMVSDVLGLLCLFPPTGKLIRRRAEKLLTARAARPAPGSLGDAFQQARMHRPDGKVVQGEVIRDDEPPRPPRQDPPLTR
ncbi:FxsA family membrane protein [Streptomyces catenulae]|uniref:FxsA family membrane protein n=1 Tax=Streptomyces catenulae TaxID=66875 RepID=A0ABV2Z752_9ACTN|nr:FxsA family membrane protein [Streptomyces catenulae]